MKRTIALLTAIILTLGAYGTVFAQTVAKGVGYNVVVNGQDTVFSDDDAINVDGVSMFTAESFVSKFTDAGLTAENVKKSAAFSFEGKEYYALRDVAAANALNVYWDKATRTALVVSKDKYDKIKELINASNNLDKDVKKVEVGFDGKVNMNMTASGQSQALDMPISGLMRVDLDAKFMEYNFKTNLFGTDMNVQMYDDGEAMYMNSGDDTWYKMESQIAGNADMLEQVQSINPTTTALAEDLSIAGLKISESGGVYTLDGNMYTSETFNGIDLDKIMGEAYSSAGIDMDVDFDWPDIMYVKYVMQGDGTINSMSIKFNMGFGVNVENESVDITLGVDLNVPKYTINGDFETTVPKTVLDAATDFSADALENAAAE